MPRFRIWGYTDDAPREKVLLEMQNREYAIKEAKLMHMATAVTDVETDEVIWHWKDKPNG